MASVGDLERLLESAQFTPSQAKIYLAGLECGSAGLTDLARHAQVSKTTAFEALEVLCRHKFARSRRQAGRVTYRMADPEHVVTLLRNTVSERVAMIDDIVRALPLFLALQSNEHPSTAIYEGVDAVHAYFSHLERVKPKHIDEIANANDLYEWIEEKTLIHARKKYHWQPKTGRSLVVGKPRNLNPIFSHRSLNPAWGVFRGNLSIYGQYVLVVTFSKRLTTIIIESKPLADSLRMLFEVAWRGANDVKQEKDAR